MRRSGSDVTVITYGGSLRKALDAANELSLAGIDCEVIDLRVLRPLDTDTIIESVRKTHRAVIVDEGWRTGSLAAEVSARIVESAFFDLDAPIARVCSAEVPMPYAKHLEQAALPQPDKIVAAVQRTSSESRHDRVQDAGPRLRHGRRDAQRMARQTRRYRDPRSGRRGGGDHQGRGRN